MERSGIWVGLQFLVSRCEFLIGDTMPSTTIKYFKYDHLPENLQGISQQIGDLAKWMEAELPDSPEKSAGMRKLLEAKDCFVRARADHVSKHMQRGQVMPTDEKKLRKLLALTYAGAGLYADDGELQDNRKLPQIDFLRDSIDDITWKMEQRALHALDS